MPEDEILKQIRTDNGLNKFITNLTAEDIKKYLIYINAKVRGISIEKGGLFQPEGRYLEDGTYEELYMRFVNLKAPKAEIQNKYFEKIIEILKNVRGRKNKATVLFYLINYLHLFEDGNGRTSRMIYDLIANGKIDEKDKSMYTHAENENIGDRWGFLNERNISDPLLVENCASFFLLRYLIHYNLIHGNNEDISKYAAIQTKIFTGSEVYINEQSKKELSAKSVFQIKRALEDNNENFSSAALAMLVILTQKKALKQLKDYFFGMNCPYDALICIGNSRDENYKRNGQLPIDISKQIFDNWIPEDYLRVIKLVDKLKECLLDLIIDFAERPNSFTNNKNITMLDVMTNKEKVGTDRSDYILFPSTQITYDTHSRIASRIEEIKSILEENIELPPIVSIEQLGTQTKNVNPNSKIEAAKKLKKPYREGEIKYD